MEREINTVKVLLRKWAEEIIHIKAYSGLYTESVRTQVFKRWLLILWILVEYTLISSFNL